MTTTQAILEGDDRNFTINFGPQHPAAPGAQHIGRRRAAQVHHHGPTLRPDLLQKVDPMTRAALLAHHMNMIDPGIGAEKIRRPRPASHGEARTGILRHQMSQHAGGQNRIAQVTRADKEYTHRLLSPPEAHRLYEVAEHVPSAAIALTIG